MPGYWINLYSKYFKIAIDLIISLIVLVLFSPVFLLIFLILKMRGKGSVIFSQQRPGLNGKPFMLYKFRTMTEAKDEYGNLLPDAQRLTGLGRFLRSSSIDELPEFFNVLKGDMSLVGPRPLLMEYLPRYSTFQQRRHEVKPGITGWAQVNGRNNLSWEERFELDVWYVDNISFKLDFKILIKTIFKVLQRKGISQQGHATMSKFTGNLKNEI